MKSLSQLLGALLSGPLRQIVRQTARFCKILVLLALALVTGQTNAQDSVAIPDGLAPEYHRCHEVLWADPMSTVRDLAKKNSEKPATGLVGLRCSDAQIIENMVHKGWIYRSTNKTANPAGIDTIRGSIVYNRFIVFCNPAKNFLDRWLFNGCIQTGGFWLLNDKVQLFGASGSL